MASCCSAPCSSAHLPRISPTSPPHLPRIFWIFPYIAHIRYDPRRRLTARDALRVRYFVPLDKASIGHMPLVPMGSRERARREAPRESSVQEAGAADEGGEAVADACHEEGGEAEAEEGGEGRVEAEEEAAQEEDEEEDEEEGEDEEEDVGLPGGSEPPPQPANAGATAHHAGTKGDGKRAAGGAGDGVSGAAAGGKRHRSRLPAPSDVVIDLTED